MATVASPAPSPVAPAAALAAGLGVILGGLAALIARAFLRDPGRVALIVPLWYYLNRTIRRFAAAIGRPPAAPRPRGASRARASRPPAILPRSRAWLIAALRHEGVGFASQLNHLLAEPANARLIAAAPHAARLLRPVCHLLGISPPALARPGAIRPSAPRPPPRPAPHPEPRPAPPRRDQPRVPLPRHAHDAADPPAYPPPLHLSAPCPHVAWPWFPSRA